MRQTLIALLTLLLLGSIAVTALAQDNKRTDQKSTTPATADSQTPTEIEKMVTEARKRGETILERCFGDCGEESDAQLPAGVELGRAVHLPTPGYPAIARAAHAEGEVYVQVLIDEHGKVIAAHAIGGHPLLQSTSVSAARKTLFTPTTLHGAPIKVTGVLRYDFNLAR